MISLIKPLEVTDFERTNHRLQYFWIYAILAAGKNSDWASKKVVQIFEDKEPRVSPFNWLRTKRLVPLLKRCRTGQYNRISRAIKETRTLDLREDSFDAMEEVFGVGCKTSRFFILHSREDAKCVPLDTHILKFLKRHRVRNVPKTTPTSKKQYLRLEKAALRLISKHHPNLSLADADLLIWSRERAKMDGK
jgi:thermostable 8-oxoguanine DNA glycosylase